MNKEYKNIISNIEEVFHEFSISNHIALAISGGCDSMALLMALKNYCTPRNIKISALTIDHKMRANSSSEAKKINIFLAKQKISHHIINIPSNLIPKSNIEAKLREIRYQLLSEFCHKNHINFLFVGHHLGDVAENFLIRLMRGSGLDGLSPIRRLSIFNEIKIIRPFLETSKDELKNYLRDQKIQWFEDETNDDEKFLRNKIRKFLASFEDKNIIEKRIYSASKEIEKARDFFDEIMRSVEPLVIKQIEPNLYLINRVELRKINSDVGHKILALLLMKISQKNYKPRREKLARFYDYLLQDEGLKKREFYGCVVEENKSPIKNSEAKIYLKNSR
ncbi:MAG: tRNA lysidine(34) synthetase TilS [Proteobacteria bacterium]|nr:tRNA lysidine(34) synthetase TilS [Pseudomonadota bacterium]NCA28642.1 tRNA lysidine(34) synthetase TilS [Pseudomonadota bacterium]